MPKQPGRKTHPLAYVALLGLIGIGIYGCFSNDNQPPAQASQALLEAVAPATTVATQQPVDNDHPDDPLPSMTATISHTGDDVVDFCISQPALERTSITPFYEQAMSGPHDPQMDTMSEDQFVNMVQWQEGHVCAGVMNDHPTVYDLMRSLGAPLAPTRGIAWVALNSYCKTDVNTACINREIDAYNKLTHLNTGKQVAASRLCLLTLPSKVTSSQQLRCIEEVGPGITPKEDVVRHCFGVIDTQEKADPHKAALKIKACFNQGLNYAP